jgi:GH25 family lysozyme M1 (1,4-beta-N-acetylmuramidase)
MLDAVIDISHHNGLQLDFRAAAADGIQGIIHKATQGVGNSDPRFSVNRTGILAAGMMFGSYHFGDGSDGGAQAKYYLSIAKPITGELVALDLENNPAGPSMTIEEARAFVTTIHNEIGKWPVLYSGHTLKAMLGNTPDPVLVNCPLWLAQYGPTAVLPPGWKTWSLWQHTDGGQPGDKPVAGIGHCDRDCFDDRTDDLSSFWASVSPD